MRHEKELNRVVFTTGQAAKICNISQQTMIRCFDEGMISGFLIPGSRHRRITKTDLLKFMEEQNLVIPETLKSSGKLLLFSRSCTLAKKVKKMLSPGMEFVKAKSTFDLGYHFFESDVILLDGCTLQNLGGKIIVELAEKQKSERSKARIAVVNDKPISNKFKFISKAELEDELPGFVEV